MLLLVIILIFLLFCLSSFWSGTETALTSLSSSRIKKIIAIHPKWTVSLRYWLEKPHYILTLILVGNTFTDMFLSSFITVIALETIVFLPNEIVEFSTWLLATFLILILGEITPKVYARRNAERFSLAVLPVYEFLLRIFGPIFSAVEFIFEKFFPAKRIVPFSRMEEFSIEELRHLFAEANLPADTSAMMEKLLGLGETDVSKIMTPVEKIEGVSMDRSDENLIDRFIETSRSRVPIIKKEPYRIVGYIHIKDILKKLASGEESIDDSMVRTAYIIPHDKSVGHLLKEFQAGNFHAAFVSDEHGNILGIVTLEDVLEELVGEILDEYDKKTK